MKYHVIDGKDHMCIKLSGNTRDNEALLVKRVLFPYLKKRGILVIVDLRGLRQVEPNILIGVLSGIRKEVDLLNGELKLCALSPQVDLFFEQNQLHRIFHVHKDEKTVIENRGIHNFGE